MAAEPPRGTTPKRSSPTSDKPASPPDVAVERAEDRREPDKASAPTGTRGSGRELAAKEVESGMAPATEKPVFNLPSKSTTLYLVTVDSNTGLPTKIERFKEETGERKELSPAEYAQAFAYGALTALPVSGTGGASAGMFAAASLTPSAAPDWNTLMQAYMQGMVDYFNQQGRRT